MALIAGCWTLDVNDRTEVDMSYAPTYAQDAPSAAPCATPYPAKAVANCFLELAKQSGVSLGAMQVQRLIYLAHGWHLAATGAPLVEEQIEAWQFGPVVPALFHEFRRWGAGAILERAGDSYVVREAETGRTLVIRLATPASDSDAAHRRRIRTLLEHVWTTYGLLDARRLARLMYAPGGPWDVTRLSHPDRKGTDIPDAVIRDHFRQKAARVLSSVDDAVSSMRDALARDLSDIAADVSTTAAERDWLERVRLQGTMAVPIVTPQRTRLGRGFVSPLALCVMAAASCGVGACVGILWMSFVAARIRNHAVTH